MTDPRREFEAILRGLTLKLASERDPEVRAAIMRDLEREIARTWLAATDAAVRECAELTHLHFKVGEDTEASDLIKDAFPQSFKDK